MPAAAASSAAWTVCEQRTDRAAEDVTGAGGGEAGVAVPNDHHPNTRPSGVATTVVGPFSSTTAPTRWSGESERAAARRSALGSGIPASQRWYSPSCGVSTIGSGAGVARMAAASGARARGAKAVAVDDRRKVGAVASTSRTAARGLGEARAQARVR